MGGRGGPGQHPSRWDGVRPPGVTSLHTLRPDGPGGSTGHLWTSSLSYDHPVSPAGTGLGRPIESWLTDMDGVLTREGQLIPGADRFIARLVSADRPFLVLTNNSVYTPRDLRARLAYAGIDVPEAAIWTSALATARFLDAQRTR